LEGGNVAERRGKRNQLGRERLGRKELQKTAIRCQELKGRTIWWTDLGKTERNRTALGKKSNAFPASLENLPIKYGASQLVALKPGKCHQNLLVIDRVAAKLLKDVTPFDPARTKLRIFNASRII
jgi:hypothetical protein